MSDLRRSPGWWVLALWGCLVALGISGRASASEPTPTDGPSHGPIMRSDRCPPPGVTTDVARRTLADRRVAQANTLFLIGEHELALVAIGQAACAWPADDYDYMRGIIFADQGDCWRAGRSMRRFLERRPAPDDIDAALHALERCRSRRDRTTIPPAPPPPTPRRLVDDPARPWFRDVLGGALAGAGVGLTLTGATVLGLQPRRETDTTFVTTGATLTALGTTMLVGAIFRYAIVARSDVRQRRRR